MLANGEEDGWMGMIVRCLNMWLDRRVNGRTGGRTGGRMGGKMGGRANGMMDR